MSTARILDQYGNPLPTARERAIVAAGQKYRAQMKASYDAAQFTEENTKHWRYADNLAPQVANSLSVRRTLRSRARYECLESNSFANGIVKTLANDFVTTGPRLQILLKDESLSREIERRWKSWCQQIGLAAKLRTARLSKCVDGEAFLMATTNPRLRGDVQLDIKLVECDQVSSPDWVEGALDPLRVDGIKFDEWGNPVEYDILRSHPGDGRGAITGRMDADQVAAEYVIHLFNVLRAGQCRGVPEVTPALPLFAFLRRFTLATILAAETAADFAVVLKTIMNAFNEDGQSPQNAFESVQIDRGMMTALPYGYEMQQMKAEHPTTTYEVFRNAILQEIARCIHMPTNKARGDSSGYNYSSARLDHQIYYHAIDVERSDWEVKCLDRIFYWWLAEAVFSLPQLRNVPLDDLPHKWTWQPVISVNPLQDAQAAELLRDAGLMTERDYFTSQQLDPDEQWNQLDKEFARRAARPMPYNNGNQPQSSDAADIQPSEDQQSQDQQTQDQSSQAEGL
jgi:lambda family phage portal protein